MLFPRPIAHRGLHDRAHGVIENSRTAFEHAIEANYAIECDLQLSADDTAIVFHDDDMTRLLGADGLVREREAAELAKLPLLGSAAGDCAQTFAALLDQVAGRTLLQVELKHQADAGATEALAEQAAQLASAYDGKLVFESFDPHLLVALRAAGYEGKSGIITMRYEDETDPEIAALPASQRFVLQNLLHWPQTRFDFISCDKSALDIAAVRLFRSLGVEVTTWTIRSSAEAAIALEAADQVVFEGFLP